MRRLAVIICSLLITLAAQAQDAAPLLPYVTAESGGPEGFSPLSIPACILWLDAEDSYTLTTSNNYVVAWRDKSPMGYSATQTNFSLRPIVSSNFLQFSSDSLIIADFVSPLSITIFAAIKRTGHWFIELSPNANTFPGWFFYSSVASAFRFTSPNNTDDAMGWKDWVPANTNVCAYIRHGITESVGEFGVCGMTNSTAYNKRLTLDYTVTNQLNIGSRNQSSLLYSGRLYEIIVYGRCLTTSERDVVCNYLKEKQRAD